MDLLALIFFYPEYLVSPVYNLNITHRQKITDNYTTQNFENSISGIYNLGRQAGREVMMCIAKLLALATLGKVLAKLVLTTFCNVY